MSAAFDLVIGLGVTGQSCLRYLLSQEEPVRAMDTRAEPPGIAAIREQAAGVPIHTGGLREDWLSDARRLIVSPGVAVSTVEIARQAAAGKEVIGDIELFSQLIVHKAIVIHVIFGNSSIAVNE